MSATSDNKRIAKNTIVLYVRMIIMLVLSFYTSRIILEALGIENLGIYNVVGGIVSLLALVNNSMSLSVQRFLSYDIGKQDEKALNTTFSTAVIIHFLIGLLIILLGETVGLYVLNNYINYPPERHEAALWVYHLSVLGSFIGIIQIPYSAIVVAYERMHIYAYFTIADVVIRLLLIYLLLILPVDKLIFMAVFSSIVGILMFIVNRVYFHYQFKNVRFRFLFDKAVFKHLFNFAGWSTFGEFAWAGTNQGTNILLNLYFGPVMNGARGMAYQIQSIVMRFVMSFQAAINPQVIKRYAAGEYESMRTLVYRGTCFSHYLALLLALPFLLEADFLLSLWLITVPEHLALFAKLILINVFLDMLTNLHAAAAKAYGKIGRYQMIVSLFLSMNFFLSFVVLHLGMPAYSVFLVYSVVAFSLVIVRLLLLRRMIPVMTISSYIPGVIVPIVKVTGLALLVPITAKCVLPESALTSFTICTLSVFSVAGSAWLTGLTTQEKQSALKHAASALPFIKRFCKPQTATVTWISYHNFGTFLQAYALQQTLLRLGYKNKIISDRHRIPPSWLPPRENALRAIKSKIKRLLRGQSTSDQLYNDFRQKHLLIDTETDAAKLNTKYEIMLCGSDQIWSPYLKFDSFYYLDFFQGRKVAYAPSIGTDRWSVEYISNTAPLLRQFSSISVREADSANALSRELGCEIPAVVDPTLLLSGEEWKKKLLRRNKNKGGYILCYFLTPNSWYTDFIQNYAKQQNKAIKVFDTHKEYEALGELVQAGPKEFLACINEADEVFTDSFHASIFSILFHKKFTTFKRFEDGGEKDQNLRIHNLFSALGLEAHFIGREELSTISSKALPDYQAVETRLQELREESISYLINALKK